MTWFSAQQKKQNFLQKRIPPEAFKPQGGMLFGSQTHFSQCKEFVFAFFGGLEEIRLLLRVAQISVSLGQALASNSPQDCCD